MFREKYPLLHYYLSFFALENGLDLTQIQGIVRRASSTEPAFHREIHAAFADDSVCWCEVLNDPVIGEIYPVDSEPEARKYAQKMLMAGDNRGIAE